MTRCPACGFTLWLPLGELSVSSVGLYDDGRFPGRCMVMLHEHFDHLDDVPAPVAATFMREMQLVGAVLRSALQPVRVNYAVLGNTDPHVHAHVIPRYGSDPNPKRPPWEHPDVRRRLATSDRDRLLDVLSREIASAPDRL